MSRKAIVAGATGLIGKELVRLLLQEEEYRSVTIIVRRPTGIRHPKLHEIVIDFALLEHADLDLRDTDVFCTLGTTIKKAGSQFSFRKVDYEYPLTLGRMAAAQGANQMLIVTAMGANSASRFFYNRVKGDIEKALQELHLPALQIFRPSLLLGKREEFRLGESIAAAVSVIAIPVFSLKMLKKYRPVQARTVAEAMMLAAQLDPAGIRIYESDQIARFRQLPFPGK